ncbi:hypothetical protein [Butyrivibrio sp. MB2005]|uniref:hypothetical protein n=1 Tax=Butyrivibrio sp. MB2005 TaxID=1280678 RepID=UPI0012DCBE8F|nr:hypothetical protein [Butyrivibrio sp. MB2005]
MFTPQKRAKRRIPLLGKRVWSHAGRCSRLKKGQKEKFLCLERGIGAMIVGVHASKKGKKKNSSAQRGFEVMIESAHVIHGQAYRWKVVNP